MDADLERVLNGLPVGEDTAAAATAVLAGSGVLAAAPTSVITRPAETAATRAVPPGSTPPAGYYGYEGPPRRRRPVWPWVLAVLLLAAAGVAAWFAYTKIQDQLNASKPVSVPSVVGIRQELAEQQLRERTLVPHVTHKASSTVLKGYVISQNPNPGTNVAKNTTVDLTISTGKPKVAVPDVIGKTRDDAVAALTSAGLKPKVVEVHSGKTPDTVTGQFPHAGTKVTRGSDVQINVSTGPKPVSVPNVVGLTYDQASSTLQSQGFGVKRVNVDSSQPKDTVVSQNPSGSAAPGATIELSVSKGPKQSTVPDVTSQDEASARSALESAGFTVTVQQQDVGDPGLNGIVLSQSPRGGTKADKGSTVTIVVGNFTGASPPPPP
jgi:serine/threonine-protein kinase